MWIVKSDCVPNNGGTTPIIGAITPGVSAAGPLVGKLSGVVSLTDILNFIARMEGLKTSATNQARLNRRRSSSSSTATSVSVTDRRR